MAVSSFGFGEMAAQAAVGMLEEAGFTPIVCHAQGSGDRAMEEMIADGRFAGVLDMCTGGVIEHLFQGNRDPGPDRLGAPPCRRADGAGALRAGHPVLRRTGGHARAARDRAHYVQDALRVQVRTTADELRRPPRSSPTNSQRPWAVPVSHPQRRVVIPGPARRPALRPDGRRHLRTPASRTAPREAVREVDMSLYTREFAQLAVTELLARLQ